MLNESRAESVFIALGGNLGDVKGNFKKALTILSQSIKIEAVSSLYLSRPQGDITQPDFLNAALVAETTLKPLPLLKLLKSIESKLGRAKSTGRWQPRTIDLDILFYDKLKLKTPELIIPHPYIFERDFVIRPLLEISSKSSTNGAFDYLHSKLKIGLEKLRENDNLYIKRQLEELSWHSFLLSLARDHRE